MSGKNERTPNDQKSDVKNPTSKDHKNDSDNHSDQLNPNNPKGSKNKKED